MIELPFPAKILWPNGRGHHMARHRETKKHKTWAFNAMLAELRGHPMPAGTKRFQLIATFYPKTRHEIDKDNASASLKAYQDGISAALGVNDKRFEVPVVMFGEPVKGGKVVIEIGRHVL